MTNTTTNTITTTNSGTAAELCVRSMQLMVDGELADFERVVHPLATNREGVAEPPACRGQGPAAFHATALWLRGVFAELAFEVHDVVADGDLVTVHNTMSGRQQGTMVQYDAAGGVSNAFPSKGRSFATTQSHWFRVQDGMVIEHWANRDDMGTALQLGWVPPTPGYIIAMARARRRARREIS